MYKFKAATCEQCEHDLAGVDPESGNRRVNLLSPAVEDQPAVFVGYCPGCMAPQPVEVEEPEASEEPEPEPEPAPEPEPETPPEE